MKFLKEKMYIPSPWWGCRSITLEQYEHSFWEKVQLWAGFKSAGWTERCWLVQKQRKVLSSEPSNQIFGKWSWTHIEIFLDLCIYHRHHATCELKGQFEISMSYFHVLKIWLSELHLAFVLCLANILISFQLHQLLGGLPMQSNPLCFFMILHK